MGPALRHDGLVLYLRDGDYRFDEIVLTRDYSEALTFLGYDAKRFFDGFDTLADMFEYVASTPYFNPDIFLLENRNNQSRVRDRKRPTYNAFLKWCADTKNLGKFEFPASKDAWFGRISEHFPHFTPQYQLSLARLERQRQVKARFNGEWVSQLTGLQGKELGALMKRFKETFESADQQHQYVLEASMQELESRVKALIA